MVGTTVAIVAYVCMVAVIACGTPAQTSNQASSGTPAVYERFLAALTATASTEPSQAYPRSPTPAPAITPRPAPLATPLPFNTRLGYTLTELRDGRILILERWRGAEIFDPANGSLTRLPEIEYAHTATLLPDGRVFIVEGADLASEQLPVTIFDSVSGEFVAAPQTARPHSWATSVLLADCTVLVIGGRVGEVGGMVLDDSPTRSEIFDTVSGSWEPGGAMAQNAGYRAVRLRDGRVVAFGVGGGSHASAEISDPKAQIWNRVAMPEELGPVLLLEDGGVLMMAPVRGTTIPRFFDPHNNSWTEGTPRPHSYLGAPVRLPDGRVLVLGGFDLPMPTAAVHIYDPVSDEWTEAPPLRQPRGGATAGLLADGRVLIVGGSVVEPDEPEVELYVPPSGISSTDAESPLVVPEYCHPAS